MSKGPGSIQRQLFEIFAENGHKILTTEALCRAVFKVRRVQKKHRVSILRGLKGMTRHGTINIYRAVLKGHRDDLWFHRDKAKSALNDLLAQAKAKNIKWAPARDKRPSKKGRLNTDGTPRY